MKTYSTLLLFYFGIIMLATAQPAAIAPPQASKIIITGATVHIGNGEVIENGTIAFENGKITYVGAALTAMNGASKVLSANGKHVYPGLIEAATTLGLNELDAIRAAHDEYEVGELNPSIRSIVAYNTDSRVIPTHLSNGITTCHIIPQNDGVGGLSSVVQLNAWNYEDATLAYDIALNITWPYRPQARNADEAEKIEVYKKQYDKKIAAFTKLFDDAKTYCNSNSVEPNLKLKSVCDLLTGKRKLIIYAYDAKSMLDAIAFADAYAIPLIIAGAYEANKIVSILKSKKVKIIVGSTHSLPYQDHDNIDQRYTLAALLKQNDIPFAISMFNVEIYKQRSLAFTAGTAAAHGLSREDALQAITLDAAKILGLHKTIGSLEVGKEATLVISEGDILDMKSSKITDVFIQGRSIELMNTQSYQYERYKQKYGLK